MPVSRGSTATRPVEAREASGYVAAGADPYVVRIPLGWMRFWVLGVMPLPGYFSLLVYPWDPSRPTGMTALIAVPFFLLPGIYAYRAFAEWRRYRDAVVAALDAAGVYVGGPPQRIPWSQITQIVVGGFHEPEEGTWTPFLVVVELAHRLPTAWAAVADPRTLRIARELPRNADIRALQAVVRRYARHIAVHRYG